MTISSWILSIAGVCVLSVIVDLFVSEGQTASHIKTVFNYVIILVILAPLPSLIKNDVNVGDFINKEEIILQEDFIYQLNNNKLLKLEQDIESDLSEKGFTQIEISISADIFASVMQVEAVFVDLSNMVIIENGRNINIEKEVTEIILKYVDIEKEKVFFDG